jgi:putative chitinase
MSLENFQKKIGVKPDGNFGPATLKAGMEYLKLSPEQAAHFFAQTSHETGNFKIFTENLNYSSQGLLITFKKYFSTQETAIQYARNPVKIANKVYANRMGNGVETSGDGWKYRGRGALQLTGKSNYQAFADFIKDPAVMTDPDKVGTEYAFDSAVFFFEKNKLWTICNKGVTKATILELTKRVNGGTNGLADREEKTFKFYTWLKQ